MQDVCAADAFTRHSQQLMGQTVVPPMFCTGPETKMWALTTFVSAVGVRSGKLGGE